MTVDRGQRDASTLPPDDAFGVLGNEARMEILRTLAAADESLSFTELHERVGTRDSGQFNYHLGKLEGHFVRKSDRGYSLRQAGRRVIEAVLSGAVTEAVVMEPTRLDEPCPYCSADIEVSYREERLLVRCTECDGSFGEIESTSDAFGKLPARTLTLYYLPSAGLQDRTPREVLAAALAWTYTEYTAVANALCPRCAASVDTSIEVCREHQTDEGICSHCNSRFAVNFEARCSNCGNWTRGTVKHHLLGDPRVRTFFEARGIDMLSPSWSDMSIFYTYEEDVIRTDPFEARFTFTAAGDDLEVTADDHLNVVDVTSSDGVRR